MAKNKDNLNITNIKKENSKLSGQFEIEIGDKYFLKVDKHFKESKINRAINEVIKNFNDSKERGHDLESIFTPYMMLIVIKHFTSLKVPNEVPQQLEVLNMLVDLDYLVDIVNQLPEKEMDKVVEKIEVATKAINDNVDELYENFDPSEIENQEVRDQLEN